MPASVIEASSVSGGGVREAIRAEALGFGFDAVGFAAASLAPEARERLAEFIAQGYHGDMAWLADTEARRGDPSVLWPEARSVLVLGSSYAPGEDPLALAQVPERGVVSVYARGRDYHDTLKRRVKALAHRIAQRWPGDLKVFVDTAPVMEKPLGEAAGIGWQGKHTNLVSRRHGSWLFLSEIYLSLDLPPDRDVKAEAAGRCGSCHRCLDACPTDAFPAPYKLDARRCISYLTIEHKGVIPGALRPAIGNRIYGCDDCLAVCPWNKFALASTEPDFLPRAELTAPRLADLCELDDPSFRTIFAGSPIKRIGRDRFLRNVLVAIGNGRKGDVRLIEAARRRLTDTAPLVRGMAAWAYGRLAGDDAWASARASALAVETEALVRDEWMQRGSDTSEATIP